LEEYLAGRAGADSHFDDCKDCRSDAGEMADQARMLRLLAAAEEIEPQAGFYARLLDAIETRRNAGAWTMFADLAFARRLTYAALAVIVILGSYLVYSEREPEFHTSSPASLLAADPMGGRQVGMDPERDREMVLVSLASYRE
jgi:predicted anti-sigma-YlaC factor YlaD